ncbi:MAG: hypothetical protein GKR93_14910 [Gammaproteobacteria bacterium]|nr:hypothetical protein [Gammaproteobacteria bacterium]
MSEINKIFAVIDPSTDQQLALQRAMRIARVSNAQIHAYLCIFSDMESHDPEALKRVEIARYQNWLESIAEQTRSEGFDVEVELEWSSDWRNALGEAAKRAGSDFIVKASRKRSTKERLMMTSSDLALLETAQCPVQLVSTEVVDDLYKVLVAVDAKREDEKYRKILESVIAYGKTVASTNENGELHAVHAYSAQDDFVHVTDVAKLIGIETDKVHVKGGDAEKAISEVANEIDAQIIVIGLSTKSTLKNRLFGSIVDGLIKGTSHDILVVIPDSD